MSDERLEGICELCERPIVPSEVSCEHDGEIVHIDCAAEDLDEIDFDIWFINR